VCVENKTEVPLGNGSRAFINAFVYHTDTHTNACHPIRACSWLNSTPLPIYGPQLHDVMAALEIKTNTAYASCLCVPQTRSTHTVRLKEGWENIGRHTHVEGGIMSTGTGSVRRETDCVTLGRLKNWWLHVWFSPRGNGSAHVSAVWWGLETAVCVCVCVCTDTKITSSSPRPHDWGSDLLPSLRV